MDSAVLPRKITALTHKYKFTIATLVTDMKEYQEMVNSYVAAGFDKDTCEYIYVDNTAGNSFDAYKGINLFLQTAQGEYIILSHQDVLVNYDNVDVLYQRINEINKKDSNWAILTNAGGVENNLFYRIAAHVVYADGFEQIVNTMPQKICSADEHFIVVKRSANLALSHNLSGFHLYGTDICLVAELLGYSAFAIDFKLTHKSYGSPGSSYYDILRQLIKKYVYFMRSRTVITTITDFRLSPSAINTSFYNSDFVKKIYRKLTKWDIRAAERKQKANSLKK